MKPEDLTGKAREYYDSWRALGLSADDALDEAVTLDTQNQLQAMFEGTGMPPAAARIAAEGRGNETARNPDPFDERVQMFQKLGLSETAAKTAVIGRSGLTETEARADLRASIEQEFTETVTRRLRPAIEAAVKACARFHALTEADAQKRLVSSKRDVWAALDADQLEAALIEYAQTFGTGPKAADVRLTEATRSKSGTRAPVTPPRAAPKAAPRRERLIERARREATARRDLKGL